MDSNIWALVISAMAISFIHTITGPDHYLPFIVLCKSKGWTRGRTFLLTIFCGVGHVLSSLVVGSIAVFFGWQLNKFSLFQEMRGNLAGWALLIFGAVYLFYGLVQAIRNRPHKHFDIMGDEVYVYRHKHGEMVMPQKRIKVTPLILFMIFVMGPSGPLTPLLFYSGIHQSTSEIIAQIVPFAFTKIATMLLMVIIGIYGYSSLFNSERLERYMAAVSGSIVFTCGVGMVFLGW